MKKILHKNSLQKLPKDKRDFQLGAIFGQIKIEEVPLEDFIIAQPILIKEQPENDDECSAYAVTSVSEDQEGEELIPQYQFLKTKEISGDPEEWGANLRDACKSAVKYGSLPFNGFKAIKNLTRSQAIIPENYPSHADDVASMHKKETFFSAIGGRYDSFDNIRTALWQHKEDKCSIVTGALFRSEWLDASNGIIPSKYGNDGFGHAFKIFGQKIIKGEVYLVAQLSQGTGVGDNGLFYLSRDIVNKEITGYGAFMFKDMPRSEVEARLNGGTATYEVAKESIFTRFWSFLLSFFNK